MRIRILFLLLLVSIDETEYETVAAMTEDDSKVIFRYYQYNNNNNNNNNQTMVSFTLFKSATIMALMAALVSAAPAKKDTCNGFRVTSPNVPFTTTAGQCYQVSYDFTDGIIPSNPGAITVEIYDSKTDKLVDTLIKNTPVKSNATPWFNVNLGNQKKSGDYYFLVKYGTCASIKTTKFTVLYNKNSPPAKC
ncbi:unnamed protein product [Mucor hiemalis]